MNKNDTDDRFDVEKNVIAGVSYLSDLKEWVYNEDREKDDIVFVILAFDKGKDAVRGACPLFLEEGFTAKSCSGDIAEGVALANVIGYEKYFG